MVGHVWLPWLNTNLCIATTMETIAKTSHNDQEYQENLTKNTPTQRPLCCLDGGILRVSFKSVFWRLV